MPNSTTSSTGSVGSAIRRRRIVWREVGIPNRSVTRTPSLPPVARPITSTICAQALGDVCPGSNERRKTFYKDLALTVRVLAKILAHLEQKAHRLASTRRVSELSRVAAMDPPSFHPTQGTARGALSRSHGDEQHVVTPLTSDKFYSLRQRQSGLHLHLFLGLSFSKALYPHDKHIPMNRWSSSKRASPKLCQTLIIRKFTPEALRTGENEFSYLAG
jgi:hypothetical protein